MQVVDRNIPRFNQSIIAILTAVGFVLANPWPVVVAFVILAVSWAGGPSVAPLTQVYVRLIRPRIGGPVITEPSAPPRFSQLIGAIFLGGATAAFALGSPLVGWALTLVVTALAALAATTRICVGCIIYEKAVAQ